MGDGERGWCFRWKREEAELEVSEEEGRPWKGLTRLVVEDRHVTLKAEAAQKERVDVDCYVTLSAEDAQKELTESKKERLFKGKNDDGRKVQKILSSPAGVKSQSSPPETEHDHFCRHCWSKGEMPKQQSEREPRSEDSGSSVA